ncbi:MAG TPA: glycosyltransferase [Rhodothermales bacterium]|nr:glycosyltransferase [Rhodothermales bacterium]HRR08857.1 glycosyltransferase [Rhodothermales bacterium]
MMYETLHVVPETLEEVLATFRVLPQTSIIIPTLNEEKILKNLLHSFPPEMRRRLGLEVIVSDGGSTDKTVEIARKYADKVVEHIDARPQTISEGRNAGAAVAQGDVLIFFNADVRFPVRMEPFLRELTEAAGIEGAATCRVTVHPEEANWKDHLVLGSCNAYFWFLNRIGLGMGRGECHAIAARTFRLLGGYRTDLVAGEDFDLFKRIAHHARQQNKAGIRFLWQWTLYEDPRRYRAIGYARTMLKWFQNAASITLFNRSVSKEWTPFR